MDAYQSLGLPWRLALDPQEIDAAWRAAGKNPPRDAGAGDREWFAAMQQARNLLACPESRLAHWMDLHGHPAEPRGVVDPPVMDLFPAVAAAASAAEGLARKRAATTTALALALLERESIAARSEIQRTLGQVEAMILDQCRDFPSWDEDPASATTASASARTLRNLRFLTKWRRSLMAAFSGLA